MLDVTGKEVTLGALQDALSDILEGEFGDRPLWFSEGEFIPRVILPIYTILPKV